MRTGAEHAGDPGKGAIAVGNVYENKYLQEHGTWMFKTDHPYTYMFVTCKEGWAMGLRPAPGISKTRPPELPSSAVSRVFPRPSIAASPYIKELYTAFGHVRLVDKIRIIEGSPAPVRALFIANTRND